MSDHTDQTPIAPAKSCGGRASGVLWWQRPVLVPLVACTLALGGVGWVGYSLETAATQGLLRARGIPLSDAWIVPGASGLGAVLVLVTSTAVWRRLRALVAIGRSLGMFAAGERCPGALRVSDSSGPGRAWNALLEWAEGSAETAEAVMLLRGEGRGEAGAVDQAADGLWHGVIIADGQQIIRYVNGAAAVFLRQRRESLPGVDIRRVVSDAGVLEAIRLAVAVGSRQRRVFDVGEAGQEQTGALRFSVRAVGRDGQRSCLIVIEDVTQQRIADAAQHAFLAQASHELRTPLTNMRLYLEQLIGEDLSAEERGTAMNVINQEIGRLDHIVGDMLSISEVQAGGLSAKSGEIRIGPMLGQLEGDFAELARSKGLAFRFEMPPKFPVLHGDREKVSMVLHNLLGNAMKYTPSGGSVRVVAREEGDRFVVDVIDTGIGISEEDAGRVFERFVRGQDQRALSQQGTGLGLALARDIARLHDGDVTLHSELDAGSTFSFWLPVGSSVGQAKAA